MVVFVDVGLVMVGFEVEVVGFEVGEVEKPVVFGGVGPEIGIEVGVVGMEVGVVGIEVGLVGGNLLLS